MNSIEIFFALIRNVIFDKPISASVSEHITDAMLNTLYKSSKAHDLSAIIFSGLTKNSILINEEINSKFSQQQLLSVYRYQCMENELRKMSELFEKTNIPFIPLKGAVIRELYAEPYFRTSCDIDILVHEEDVERAVALLTEKNGYINKGRSYHDYSLHSENGVHIELHFNLLENMENIDCLLVRAWDFASSCDGSCRYRLTNEFILFHTVAHMSYHFVAGGCGIRPFIDLYLLENKNEIDRAVFEKMISDCGLDKFYGEIKRLCHVWFEGCEHNELTREMERFILTGGVNGNKKKSIAARQQKKGGKYIYLLERIFQPYAIMKEKYPILKKHGYLLPFYQIKRWFSLVFNGKISKLKKEYEADKSVNVQQANEMNAFLSKLGIK